MTYDEFERHILRLVYEDGIDRFQPSYIAYALELPHETVTMYIEYAVDVGMLEMEVGSQGRIDYRVPGVDREKPLPTPLWKQKNSGDNEDNLPVPIANAGQEQTTSLTKIAGKSPAHSGRPAADTLTKVSQPRESPVAHVKKRLHDVDGTIYSHHVQGPVVGFNARTETISPQALTVWNENAFRIETTSESFCDPSQTVFMRQIRVYGVESEAVLREHVKSLFESAGYRMMHSERGHLKMERGSVAFILALVPLFVLVVPLFVYLCMYCMGRSTIHQEPVELDIRFRERHENGEPYYEVDLTFIGLHGVVLGAADQRVLNQEIDTLREELRWSLSPD